MYISLSSHHEETKKCDHSQSHVDRIEFPTIRNGFFFCTYGAGSMTRCTYIQSRLVCECMLSWSPVVTIRVIRGVRRESLTFPLIPVPQPNTGKALDKFSRMYHPDGDHHPAVSPKCTYLYSSYAVFAVRAREDFGRDDHIRLFCFVGRWRTNMGEKRRSTISRVTSVAVAITRGYACEMYVNVIFVSTAAYIQRDRSWHQLI